MWRSSWIGSDEDEDLLEGVRESVMLEARAARAYPGRDSLGFDVDEVTFDLDASLSPAPARERVATPSAPRPSQQNLTVIVVTAAAGVFTGLAAFGVFALFFALSAALVS